MPEKAAQDPEAFFKRRERTDHPSVERTAHEEDRPEHGHRRLPWVLDLVKNGVHEYAEKVRKTQGWRGGWGFEEPHPIRAVRDGLLG